MIFNQLEFLFLFLPAVVLLFVSFPNVRHGTLIAASIFFYAVSGIDHAAMLLFVSVWTWHFCRDAKISGNGWRLALSIAPAVTALLFYKYLSFALRTAGITGGEIGRQFSLFENAVLPAGISFFTFHLVAYAIDRYMNRIAQSPPLRDFLLFMSFFPHLVAGPILRYADVSRSIDSLEGFRIDLERVARCLGHMAVGLGLKVLLADTLGAYIGQLVKPMQSIGAEAGVFVILAYSFQIYFDFFGYSLIAIGLGHLFGFEFPRNFDDPYKAADIREFWRRWHMTLSYWIRDYLYLPLGGNEKYVRNILIVFAICGLWHGAGWNFVLWGIAHGVLVAIYHYAQSYWNALPRLLRVAATFAAVSLLWLLFLFDFEQLTQFANAILENGLGGAAVKGEMWVMLGLAALVCFAPGLPALLNNATGGRWIGRNLLLGGVFAVSIIFLDRSDTFIYFRF